MLDEIEIARAKELYAQGDYAGARKILEPLAGKNTEAATMLSFVNTAQAVHNKMMWVGRGLGLFFVLGIMGSRFIRNTRK